MSFRLTLQALFIYLLTFSASASTEAIQLVLEKPIGKHSQRVYERLQDSSAINIALSFLNKTFAIPRTISLHFGNYEEIWYQQDRIEIPYEFITFIRENYSNSRFPHKRVSLDDFTGNALLHIIFHEFAHALIEQYDLPIIGREEEAADNFSDVMLLHFFEDGEEIISSAADFFYINSIGAKRFSKQELWSDHSLDIQRYYRRICNAYGSNPDKGQFLKRRVNFDNERAERCIFQYEKTLSSWLKILQPIFKN